MKFKYIISFYTFPLLIITFFMFVCFLTNETETDFSSNPIKNPGAVTPPDTTDPGEHCGKGNKTSSG